jgi:hypothetical protein
MENKEKTAYDLLVSGFNRKPPIIQALKLGETRIPLNVNEYSTLAEAINAKDYYEIKNIVSELHERRRE